MAFVKACLCLQTAPRVALAAMTNPRNRDSPPGSRSSGGGGPNHSIFLLFSAFAAAEAEMAKLPPEGVSVEAMQIFNALSKT